MPEQRLRAVRLTDDAVGILERRLFELWKERGHKGDLTRTGRAKLLGISVATCNKIFTQQGNDRAILVEVFNKAQIPWQDQYCMLVGGNLEGRSSQSVSNSSQFERQPNARGKLHRTVAIALISATLIVGTSVGAIKVLMPRTIEAHRINLNAMSDRCAHFLELGRNQYRSGHYASAKYYTDMAYRIAKEAALADRIADSLSLMGEICAVQGNLASALKMCRDALLFWSTIEHAHGRAALLESMGELLARNGELDQAVIAFKDGLQTCKYFDDPGLNAGMYRGLGTICALRGETDAAKKWFSTAADCLKQRPNDLILVDLRARHALVLAETGHTAEALNEISACLQRWTQLGHERWIASTQLQVAYIRRLSKDSTGEAQALKSASELFRSAGDQMGAAICSKWSRAMSTRTELMRTRAEIYF